MSNVKPQDLFYLHSDMEALNAGYKMFWEDTQKCYPAYSLVVADVVMEVFDQKCKEFGIEDSSNLRAVFEQLPYLHDLSFTPRMSILRLRGMMLTEDGWYGYKVNVNEAIAFADIKLEKVDPQPDFDLDLINKVLAEVSRVTGVKIDLRVYKLTK